MYIIVSDVIFCLPIASSGSLGFDMGNKQIQIQTSDCCRVQCGQSGTGIVKQLRMFEVHESYNLLFYWSNLPKEHLFLFLRSLYCEEFMTLVWLITLPFMKQPLSCCTTCQGLSVVMTMLILVFSENLPEKSMIHRFHNIIFSQWSSFSVMMDSDGLRKAQTGHLVRIINECDLNWHHGIRT